jgi:hypothetical protein
MRQPLRSDRQELASDETPITAWATQTVTTSASVTLRRAFFGLSGRRSSAVQNTS